MLLFENQKIDVVLTNTEEGNKCMINLTIYLKNQIKTTYIFVKIERFYLK